MNMISANPESDRLTKFKYPVDCIVANDSSPEILDSLHKISRHVVITSNRDPTDGFIKVINDDIAIGRMGAEYFLQRGFRTLAFVLAEGMEKYTPNSFQFALQRAKGFSEAGVAGGATVHAISRQSQETSHSIVQQLLALPNPVGVMTSSDLHARWLIEAMEDPFKWVPKRLAILGVDNDPFENALSPMAISSVSTSGKRIGFDAAALGVRLFKGAAVPEDPIRVTPLRVVTRQSTSIFAVSDPLVLKALQLIHERISDPIDTSDLVRILGTSRRTLELHFRKELGSSPAKELLQARIQRATELLASTDLSIKEIAYLVGFSEPRLLSRCFQQTTGERPTAYRERILAGFHLKYEG